MTACTRGLVRAFLVFQVLLCSMAAAQSPVLKWKGRFPDAIPPAPYQDHAADLVEFNGFIYVTGEYRVTSDTTVFATCKYAMTATGGVSEQPLAVAYWPDPLTASRGDRRPVAIDASVVSLPTTEGPSTGTPRPTIFVTGIVPASGGTTDWMTIAYDENLNPAPFWMERLDDGGIDIPVEMRAFGNLVAVTGTNAGQGTDIRTVLYNAIDGSLINKAWLASAGSENDTAAGLVIGNSVFIAGTTTQSGVTVMTACAYDLTTGAVVPTWPRFFTPPGKRSGATCLTVPPGTGYLHVGGWTSALPEGSPADYLTASFVSGSPDWYDMWDYAGGDDRVASIDSCTWKPNAGGGVYRLVYVTGHVTNSAGGVDVGTLQLWTDQFGVHRSARVYDHGFGADHGVVIRAVQGLTGLFTGPTVLVSAASTGSGGDTNFQFLKYKTGLNSQQQPELTGSLYFPEVIYADPAGGNDVPTAMYRQSLLDYFDFVAVGRSWGGSLRADDFMTLHYREE